MALTIRGARISELNAVMALLKELDEAHVELEPTLLQRFKGEPRPREWLELRFNDPNEACLVATLDGDVAGFVWCKSQSPPGLPAFIQEPLLVVGDLVVQEPLRGRGIGRALLEAALDWGRARGLKRAQLTVFDRNQSAREFYAELEFRPLSVVLMRDI
ncbi:MAG: GNAT family N-acetyltransferase [Polyangiaceae bacterium]